MLTCILNVKFGEFFCILAYSTQWMLNAKHDKWSAGAKADMDTFRVQSQRREEEISDPRAAAESADE